MCCGDDSRRDDWEGSMHLGQESSSFPVIDLATIGPCHQMLRKLKARNDRAVLYVMNVLWSKRRKISSYYEDMFVLYTFFCSACTTELKYLSNHLSAIITTESHQNHLHTYCSEVCH